MRSRKGFTAILEDPWGNRYRVAADWSGDNTILAAAMSPHPELSGRSVAVWSLGQDSQPNVPAQHIRSWTD